MFCECDFCNYQNAKLFYTDYYARNQLESIKKARPSIIKALIDSTIFFTTSCEILTRLILTSLQLGETFTFNIIFTDLANQ